MTFGDPLPDWFRFIVVPILIGLISSMVGFFLNLLSAKTDRERSSREMQVAKAAEVCTKVIDTLDNLHSDIKYSAWYVAWRKALPPTADYVGSDLQKTDEESWKDYNVGLKALREHHIEFETELKGSFGENAIEPILYLDIDAKINEIADTLSMIYYSNETGDFTMWLGGAGRPCLEMPKDGFTEKDRLESRDEFVHLCVYLRLRIKILSQVMIHCIQRGNIGTLPKSGNELEFSADQMKQLKETAVRKKSCAPEQA
jgi:hypothetical protein